MHEVLYSDPWLIAVHKPSGVLVHRTEIDRHETRFMVQEVRQMTGRKVWAVHRLDKGTSGVLLFAFDPQSAAAASALFELQQVRKFYRAIVRGRPLRYGVIRRPLRVLDSDGKPSGTEKVQDAVTYWERLSTADVNISVDPRYPASRYSLLHLEPMTGRRHQLRRHLKHLSNPIIGDATYGKGAHNRMIASEFGLHRLLLACCKIEFDHPILKSKISVSVRSDEMQLAWQSISAIPSRSE